VRHGQRGPGTRAFVVFWQRSCLLWASADNARANGRACATRGILLHCPASDRESRPVGDRIEWQARTPDDPTEAERPRALCSTHGDATFCVLRHRFAGAVTDRQLEIDRFMTASLVFRLAHTRLAAACVAGGGLLPVRAAKAGVCPVPPRRGIPRADQLVARVVHARSMVEPWFTGRYSGQLIATSKRGLDWRITKSKYSAQTGMEGPGPAA
jgi:hypothetical protein